MFDVTEVMKQDGCVLVPDVISSEEIVTLRAFFETAELSRAERDGKTYGARNLLDLPEIRKASSTAGLARYLEVLLGHPFLTVRAIFFDKTEGANWPVLWHQDLSVAVKERRDMPGWTGWSVKRGVLHVQAPDEILERMVTVRIHLDDCPPENGALRTIAGSHRHGRLTRDTIRKIVATEPSRIIAASAGDALFMRPLILHASSPAQIPVHRRVLHLEFAPVEHLPAQMQWAHVV